MTQSIWVFVVPLGLGAIFGFAFLPWAHMRGHKKGYREGQAEGQKFVEDRVEQERMAKLRKLHDAGRRQEKRTDAGPPTRIHNAKIHSPYRPNRGRITDWKGDDQE